MPLLNFKGKSIVRTHHLNVPYRQLVPHPRKSVLPVKGKPTLDDNLIIHGDNLEALKALLPSFSGRIKCIYIDPPYNTGNEGWAYNDNVNSPMHAEWLKKVVDKDDLTRHDKWLCMIWPRLTLLRDLLSDDGAIFISIDDNEVHHLRSVMDEIFGEGNFIANVVWQHSIQGKGYTEKFSVHHNHIVIYQKSDDFTLSTLARTEEHNRNYSNPDNDPKGNWRSGDIRNALYRPNLIYDVKTPSGKVIKPPPNGWRFSKDTMQKKIEAKQVVFASNETRLVLKIYLKDVEGRVPETIWFGKDAGTTRDGKNVLKEIFEGPPPFDTPKPVELIRQILNISTDETSLILDSFAGSGTTAHAVLALNAEDGGNRRFILVEQEDYADTITAERVRRVIKGVPNAKDEKLQLGYGGSFSYFTLGPRLDDDGILQANELPAYKDLARYAFFTATGEQWDESQIDEGRYYLGESKRYQVYLIYQPNIYFIKNTPLTLDFALALPQYTPNVDKLRLVIASHKYLDDDRLREYGLEFCQLPFSIYKFRA